MPVFPGLQPRILRDLGINLPQQPEVQPEVPQQLPVTSPDTLDNDSVPDERGVPRFRDGLIDFAKAMAPILAGAGLGVTLGGGTGALFGTRAGAEFAGGLAQGKIDREQRDRQFLLDQQAADARSATAGAALLQAQSTQQRTSKNPLQVSIPGGGEIVLSPDGKEVLFDPENRLGGQTNTKELKEELDKLISLDQFGDAEILARSIGLNFLADGLKKRAELEGGPDLSAAQKTKMSDIKAANLAIEDLFQMIDLPEIADNLGPYTGRVTQAQGKYFGGKGVPISFVSFDSFLNNLVDKTLRIRTGAAAPPSEQLLFKLQIVGDPSMTPNALKAKLFSLRRFNELEKAAIDEGDPGINYMALQPKSLVQMAVNGDERAKQLSIIKGLIPPQ